MSLAKKLEIKNLHVRTEDKEILKGLDLTINVGEIHAIMRPNGSGKSTLANTLLGHPNYEITDGDILLDGESLLEMEPDERAKRGLFLAFQYPAEIPGVSVMNFLRLATKARVNGNGKEMSISEFRKLLKEKLELLQMDDSFLNRYLNDGFSGGEKKRMEILQLAVLKPSIAILDETDSGLDIDALKTVAAGFNSLVGPDFGALVITHYQRILNYIKPNYVHILVDGKIAKSGGPELALHLEEHGYAWITEK
ncbi:MAG: Fe-S cluster assembly ATPase SufC [candidate division KSB1 bacterium]|nr:Fe-S cluster assembly ATPase SufC [candidate division KSB1 bacterium]